jgi:multiple sugar transport system ATP-binding protein
VAQVVLEDIYKSYSVRQGERAAAPVREGSSEQPGTSVLKRVNLTIKDGEFLVLVGPSGCGKSTLLRLIAGLEQLTAGNIWVGDRLINALPPKARDIAMVFQSYALYPHMSVYNNLAFGLRRMPTVVEGDHPRLQLPAPLEAFLVSTTRPLPKGLRYFSPRERAIDQRVRSIAQILQIEALLHRLPKQLSGGQKQRVALGRAMARNPQVFLMDEPLSNLDAKLRAETRAQIVKLQRQLGTTTIYVTHDQTEAMTMGDRIAVMNGGQIQQLATPLELYNHPANLFVAEFIGSPPMNFLPMQVADASTLTHPAFQLCLPAIWSQTLANYQGQSLTLGIRAEHWSVVATANPADLPVQVELVEALGHETYLAVQPLSDPEPTLLQVRVNPDQHVQVGDRLNLALNLEKIHLFDPSTGLALNPDQPKLAV